MEIERKWMVTGWPEGLTQTSDYQMDQGYISCLLYTSFRTILESEIGF